MLVALAEDQSYVILTQQLPRAALQQLRKEQAFFCPQCKEPLILKIGQIKIPHFSHQKHSQCDSFFSEGESSVHLLGKQQLFAFFQRLQLDVELEPFLAELQQRPDLLVTTNGKRYAIEFQYSRLESARFLTRTDGYKAQTITPIWILSTPSDPYRQQGIIKISINHFQRLFLQQRGQPYILTYDVNEELFYYVSHLLHFHGQQYFGFGQAIALTAQVFPFYVPARLTLELFQSLWQRYKQENNRHLHARLMFSRAGVKDELLRAMYELKLTREQLPLFIGVPLKGQELLSMPAVEWQILLFYFVQSQQFSFSSLTKAMILHFLEQTDLAVLEESYRLVRRYVQLLNHFHIDTPHSKVEKQDVIRYIYNELFAIE